MTCRANLQSYVPPTPVAIPSGLVPVLMPPPQDEAKVPEVPHLQESPIPKGHRVPRPIITATNVVDKVPKDPFVTSLREDQLKPPAFYRKLIVEKLHRRMVPGNESKENTINLPIPYATFAKLFGNLQRYGSRSSPNGDIFCPSLEFYCKLLGWKQPKPFEFSSCCISAKSVLGGWLFGLKLV